MLTGMSAGDVITVDEAVYETDMDAESVRVVLDVLTRADLFEHHGEQFMRVTSASGIAFVHHDGNSPLRGT